MLRGMLLLAVLLTACEPPVEPEPPHPEFAYVIRPASLTPDHLIVGNGEIIQRKWWGRPDPPQADHVVEWRDPRIMRCVTNREEHEAHASCDTWIEDGDYVLLDQAVADAINRLACPDAEPRSGPVIGVANCFGLTVYERGHGPDLEYLANGYTVAGCGPTWISYGLKRQHLDTTAVWYPLRDMFGDTTRISVSPCTAG